MTAKSSSLFNLDLSLVRDPAKIHNCVSRVMQIPCSVCADDPAFSLLNNVLVKNNYNVKFKEDFAPTLGDLLHLLADYDHDNNYSYDMCDGDPDYFLRFELLLTKTVLSLLKSLSQTSMEVELFTQISVSALLKNFMNNPCITADEILSSLKRHYNISPDSSIGIVMNTLLKAYYRPWDTLDDSLESFKQKNDLLMSISFFIFVSAMLNAAGKEY